MSKIEGRARVALGLWIAWGVVVWNVVFDHTIEVAGRAYLHAAAVAAQSGGPYRRAGDWMHAAVTGALASASTAAAAIIGLGVVGIRLAISSRSAGPRETSSPPDRPIASVPSRLPF
jgi:hypothetical protein